MVDFYEYTELREDIREKISKEEYGGFVINDIMKYDLEEVFYEDTWRSFIDRYFGRVDIGHTFDLFYSCRFVSYRKNYKCDLVAGKKGFEESLYKEDFKGTKISLLHRYVNGFNKYPTEEKDSVKFFEDFKKSLPSYESKVLLQDFLDDTNHKIVYISKDHSNPYRD